MFVQWTIRKLIRYSNDLNSQNWAQRTTKFGTETQKLFRMIWKMRDERVGGLRFTLPTCKRLGPVWYPNSRSVNTSRWLPKLCCSATRSVVKSQCFLSPVPADPEPASSTWQGFNVSRNMRFKVSRNMRFSLWAGWCLGQWYDTPYYQPRDAVKRVLVRILEVLWWQTVSFTYQTGPVLLPDRGMPRNKSQGGLT